MITVFDVALDSASAMPLVVAAALLVRRVLAVPHDLAGRDCRLG